MDKDVHSRGRNVGSSHPRSHFKVPIENGRSDPLCSTLTTGGTRTNGPLGGRSSGKDGGGR